MGRVGERWVRATRRVAALTLLALISTQIGTSVVPMALAGRVDDTSKRAPALPTLAWASTDYAVREPAGAVVLLHVVVSNPADEVTHSTSIEWDPEFAAVFTFLESDPPAWRARVDEASGWGVVDTNGVLDNQDGTFLLWFGVAEGAAVPPGDIVPRVRVIADGGQVVGVGEATPLHAAERARVAQQWTFERGWLASVADGAAFVPSRRDSVLPVVVGLGAMLLAAAGAGLLAAAGGAARSA